MIATHTPVMGNAATILAETPAETQDVMNRRTVDDVFRLWITPEIERRQRDEGAPKPFPLAKAQVVLNVDQPIQVRLNDEVKAVMLVEVDEATKASLLNGQSGQPIYWDQVKNIADVRLTETDANAAHITLLVVPGRGWGMFFDFRYNAARVATTVDAAEQFLATADFAANQGHSRAMAENLFHASELTAKGLLLMLPFPEVVTTRKHGTVASTLNRHGRSAQNVDSGFVALHNELLSIRGDARYLRGDVPWTSDEMKAKVALVRGVLDHVKARAPKRGPTLQA
jgi:HEPN domain-containing protein